jgi:hypothetical protein
MAVLVLMIVGLIALDDNGLAAGRSSVLADRPALWPATDTVPLRLRGEELLRVGTVRWAMGLTLGPSFAEEVGGDR